MEKKKVIYILVVFIIGLIFLSGTLAYYRWESDTASDTEVTLSIEKEYSCSADGGGDITNTDAVIAPTNCMDSTHAIQRELTVTPTLIRDDININTTLYLQVDLLDSGLSNSENFRYAITTSNTSCETGVISAGNFKGLTIGDQVRILNENYSTSIPQKYYLYIWLDKEETSSSTMNQKFKFSITGSCTDEVKPEEPVLDDGMIPVTIANNGTVKTILPGDEDWHDYENKKWANVVLVNNESRASYKGTTGKTVTQSDILAYYVWIPRYSYKIWTVDATTTTSPQTIEIGFEAADAEPILGTTVDSRRTHPAFIWDGSPVAGIWVGKFETGHSTLSSSTTNDNLSCTNENCTNADGLIIKPNVVALRYNSLSNFFYASRSISRNGNPFGLNSSTTDTHMMKNSEWGAVAYLSHSKYGINSEIRINNNNSYTTGCGATSEKSTPSCEIAYADATSYPQSTTGNITGVFDMSGGTAEYVMGNYNNTIKSDGFTTMPSSKYYDLYLASQFTGDFSTNMSLCTIETCGGHELFETAGWDSDFRYFVDADFPWFTRGGYRYNGSYVVVWNSSYSQGLGSAVSGFRSVAIVGT